MDSSSDASALKEKGLSAEGVAVASLHAVKPTPSPTASNHTGCKKPTSLDNSVKKKVGQSRASRCENPHGMHFICKHGHTIYRTLRCHARFKVDCPSCASKWRKKTVDRYSMHVRGMKKPKFVTLTLRKGGRHKLEELPQLGHRFRKYLRRDGYKITRFVSCLEPPNHVHFIVESGYIPQKVMSDVWKEVTKDSFIVDIRKIRVDDEGEKKKKGKMVDKKLLDEQRWRIGVYYITKYITEISRVGSAVGLRGVHIINSWGGCVDDRKIRMVCRKCGSYFEPLWFCGQVDDVDNDNVNFVDIDKSCG